MIRTLRAFFLGCHLREKLLVVVFLAIAVLLWLSGFSRRATQFWRDQHRTTVDLADQAQWISHSAEIDAAAQKAAARFDAARTLDGTRLLEAVQKIAADLGLRNTQSPGATNPPGNGQSSLHTLPYNVQFNDPDGDKNWKSLVAFYTEISKRAPYMGIEQFTLVPNANKAQLRLQLQISSVEITKTR